MGAALDPSGYYTTGVFDEEVNMPSYMIERTGVNGLRGFGDDQNCMQPQEAAQSIVPTLRALASRVPIPGAGKLLSMIPGVQVEDPTLDKLLPNDDTLVPLLADGLREGASAFASGKEAAVEWLAGKIAADVIHLDNAIVVNLLKSGLNALGDKLITINICTEEPLPKGDVTCEVACGSTFSRQPPATQEFIRANCNCNLTRTVMGSQYVNFASNVRSLVPQAANIVSLLQAEQAAAAMAPTPAASGGSSTVMLLGAAALAALFFMR
jgi:hypothetical protein